MDLFKKTNAWLQKVRTEHGSPVTYQRASSSASFNASVGFKQYVVTDSEGFQVGKESWDFIVQAADLELDGEAATPQTGDRIIVGDLDDGVAYEVMPIAGDKCWTWSGSFGTTYRIHTKRVGVQPAQR